MQIVLVIITKNSIVRLFVDIWHKQLDLTAIMRNLSITILFNFTGIRYRPAGADGVIQEVK